MSLDYTHLDGVDVVEFWVINQLGKHYDWTNNSETDSRVVRLLFIYLFIYFIFILFIYYDYYYYYYYYY